MLTRSTRAAFRTRTATRDNPKRDWYMGSGGTVNRLKTSRTSDPSGLRYVPQRAQLTTGDGFGHGKRVASEQVDVLVAER